MLVDTHCHLDQLPDPATTLAEAAAQGITQVVAVSESADSMPSVLALALAHPGTVVAGLGLHPAWISQQPPEAVAAGLEFLAAHLPQARVLGEVGLDHQWATTPEEQAFQEEVLARQLALAAAAGKPINLHSRRCPRQVMERAIAFSRQTGLGAQLHWFTHSRKLIHQCNEAGVYVSVGPMVLADPQTQEVALAIADELLLLETDTPVPISGQPNHPARTRAVAEKLAALKGLSLEDLAALTTANFRRYLGVN
ncbi:MAG: TatD family hydrolase [Candidatus Latescibacteria bacterium]|nr:TatD family hydrolase [Candidatus Latescibacterota bacterium]